MTEKITQQSLWLKSYLIRGKGVVSVEQLNCISSPSIRQALSSRDKNLGGAGEKEKYINVTIIV